MISEIKQETSDINWFFVSGNKIGFVASGAGKLPGSVAYLDEKLGLLWSYFKNIPETSEVLLNLELESIKTTVITNDYLEDFIFMAKRGLYTFDKTTANNFRDTNYHLVAKPANPLLADTLPVEIFTLISNTLYKVDIEGANGIDVKTII
ncbi:hypothetical protein Q765_03535 [Flavobacterium rivuli WB 3.3-2 = DSM 21788]|uniref:Uncharacterized protein n=1 Tax=Flavobacterium rivuli WB 3.3-2 = DSM 21788 TaxID=1121895 RepID=A0A0A2M651_9FLAO|nr:hypothetical protein [Flavobacterium rivuli]KGO88132.1 hypothetical protein Q765_03535 [Flavobacterium rivuli WB 3.3-2 = DSM 21788]